MNERLEIQARRQHRDGVSVRDESRLARADNLDDATRTAYAWVAEGFTVWIYRVEPGNGVQPVYHSVQELRPTPSPPAAAPPSRTRGPRGHAIGRAA